MAHAHRELVAADPPDGTPYIDIVDVQWLYYVDWYDGPLSGMVVANVAADPFSSPAEPLWAECFDECDAVTEDDIEEHPCGFYRRYTLTRLTAESAAAEVQRHRLFQEYVGTHLDVGLDGRPRLGREAAKPRSEHHHYEDIYADHPVCYRGDVVGWFQT